LRASPHSLSFNQIIDRVRLRAPMVLAQFHNPGVALSNALRTLERRGEVEHGKSGHRRKWRWKRKPEPRLSSDAQPHQRSPEIQPTEGEFFGNEECG
jgi:hypothetical protein